MVEIQGEPYLSAAEACELLGVKPATLYAYVSRGVLRSYRQGIKRARLYRRGDVQRVLHLRPSRGTRLKAALRACASSHDHERAHMARALRDAPSWLLSEPLIQSALETLRNDRIPLVRADAAWSEHCHVRQTVKQKIVYRLLYPMLNRVHGVRSRAVQLARRARRSA